MPSNVTKIITCGTFALGVGLWGSMAKKYDADGRFACEMNPGCIKGSPYGKILALAMQGPIDFYWHGGKTHDDEVILGSEHGHKHEHTEDCAHHGCNHDHAEHHHDHAHAAHPEGCSCCAHSEEHEHVAAVAEDETFRTKLKERIKEMEASTHRKTDGKPLSETHQKYLQGVTEDKLRLAYELDPSNYTNYGNYHLFIATTTFGKSAGDDDAAVALARRTLEYCKHDQIDPASWVTAASAAYNIICHIGRHYDQYSVREAKDSLAEFDFCISNYVRLRRKALEAGRVVSETRVKEMEARVSYLIGLRKAQGIYMKRVMTANMDQVCTRFTAKEVR